MESTAIKKTALFNIHENLGAKIVPFAGYFMPVYYTSIIDEHRRVRSTVGLFDVSHMGEFEIKGHDALAFVQRVTTNDAADLKVNQVQYSVMCYPDGGIVDDLLVYRLEDHYLFVVNAANLDKDFSWLQDNLRGAVQLENKSDATTLLALQGPQAETVLSPLVEVDLCRKLGYYYCQPGSVIGHPALISRTGYTGEDGFEIYCAPRAGVALWEALMESGRRYDIQPIGLGARDTLRLEMKYALYGNDIDQTTNPLEAGLGWVVKFDKDDFIGKEALLKVQKEKLKRRLVGFETDGKIFPRKGMNIHKEESEIGTVTSGTFSPSLEKGIGLGYVSTPHTKVGTEIGLDIRGKRVGARVVKTPFYKSGSHK
ncbi:MAG: glycine cleavage system aminomethyltransferase GcvT [Gemmatimonadota bacterium]|nr:MAG: glycine cleavage system aminomethyltransferase GcvT [Gemmatimonadota bacterium]